MPTILQESTMSHSIDYEAQQGGDRGKDFTVKAAELTQLQNKMMDLAAMAHRPSPRLSN